METKVPSNHEFMDDLASLVEEHEARDEFSRYELLRATQVFGEEWLMTLYLTGQTW